MMLLLLLMTQSIEVLTSPPSHLLRHNRSAKYHQLALVTLAASVCAVRLVALERNAHAVITAARTSWVSAAGSSRRIHG